MHSKHVKIIHSPLISKIPPRLILMASPVFPPLFFLLLLLLNTATSSDISILHSQSRHTPSSPPSITSILSSAALDPLRISLLSIPLSSGLQLTQSNNYILHARLGTPPQPLFLSLGTSSGSSWVPCSPSTSSFDPSTSTTYATVDCSSPTCQQFKGQFCGAGAGPTVSCGYNVSYGASRFAGRVSKDSLWLGSDVAQDFLFGCLDTAAGNTALPKWGLLGLGHGPNGLLAQTGSLYQGIFSYCLPGYKSYYFSGSLRLGPAGQPKTIRTTPLLSNPHRPALYYVNLTGVSVGRVNVVVPAGSFAFDPQTGAGTIVDSGTVITRFVAPAYAAIRDEFRRQVNASSYSDLGAFDTCFATSGDGPVTPAVTLHLPGLDLRLPMENTLIHSSSQPLACFAFAAAPDNVNNVVNVVANYQQQNHRVLIDAVNSKVGFARESCS